MKRYVKSSSARSTKVQAYSYDDLDSCWEELDSKQVPDLDGFYTDYTLYHNTETGQYVCMFGDKDIYKPGEGYYDFECETYEEAIEWFENYEGFVDDEVDGSTDVQASSESITSQDISDWLSDHSQAYSDCCDFFGVNDLSTILPDALESWISDHEMLWDDYVDHFELRPDDIQ